MENNVLISYQSISKRFGGVQALEDVSFPSIGTDPRLDW